MMNKRLKIPTLQNRLDEQGLTQTTLAEKVGKTRAAVSKWMKGDSFPRAPELLKIGKILGLKYRELVEEIAPKPTPLVAFRKRGSTKTKPEHLTRAEEMGRSLELLVEYLDFDEFMAPGRLKNPSCNYDYLQQVAAKLRRELGLSDSEPIHIRNLIKKFSEHQSIIIPTLWGKKNRHENALHIYLPESETTWIYLNLDSEKHDFKFWMAHELGHVLSVDFLEQGQMEEADDFADAFAGALLFPKAAADKTYLEYRAAHGVRNRVKLLCGTAEKFGISPLSVYKELEKFTVEKKLQFSEVESGLLHSAIAKFNQKHPTMSEELFDGTFPSADHFMRISAEKFGTAFYRALGNYVNERKVKSGVVARILDIPLMDARAFHEALVSN